MPEICKLAGCAEVAVRRGLCVTHYLWPEHGVLAELDDEVAVLRSRLAELEQRLAPPAPTVEPS